MERDDFGFPVSRNRPTIDADGMNGVDWLMVEDYGGGVLTAARQLAWLPERREANLAEPSILFLS
jgi:hypothetical protein